MICINNHHFNEDDKDAEQLESGEWMCGPCIEKLFTPHEPSELDSIGRPKGKGNTTQQVAMRKSLDRLVATVVYTSRNETSNL